MLASLLLITEIVAKERNYLPKIGGLGYLTDNPICRQPTNRQLIWSTSNVILSHLYILWLDHRVVFAANYFDLNEIASVSFCY